LACGGLNNFWFQDFGLSELQSTGMSMSSQNANSLPKPTEAPVLSKSGVRAALEHTGIPPSWFEKRPKLPSRNWLIFLSVTTSIVSCYIYDRRECKRIRAEYASRVEHLAQEPLRVTDMPRKVTVYGAKWPGDEDHDKSLRFFRKYVKVHTIISL
jgi:import inner membrane translocase subunit TIM54